MQKLIMLVFTAFLSFAFVVPDADAGKRFGGGSSIGKSFSTPKKTSPTSQDSASATGTTAQKSAAAPTAAAKKPGMGGLLGGLLAGGLLGALFFGGAFEGIQFMDILLIGLLAFMAFKLFGMFRRQQPAPAYAGQGQGAAQARNPFEPAQPEPMARSSEPQPAFSPAAGFGAGLGAKAFETPSWFNAEAFLEGAKGHFVTLQNAWDLQDWDQIRSYVSPELLVELQRERARNGDQRTEVVSVMAELANFIDQGNQVVASLNFYGWLKEDSDQTTEFNEVWHLTRDMSVPDADWIIVGIEQP
ncbi:preprotein translocase subunit Tim44 [Marinobacterium nitratireducens]|uniref:Preprotein translocase subunit Tim44 n=1 Tax=Marinobacterium nitratireducens TaxID=518897 RepID=A0A917ZH97_9GAMM|nr:TIM44-like domain-containing protein [Marinobacterium nitratireducens]GGO82763.1 preprotein translocase subunit Tim44 [Marinobacterium nitratireducens]